MMWHWLVSGLASGVTVVLYNGSPFMPLEGDRGMLAMSKLIDELGYEYIHHHYHSERNWHADGVS